MKAWVGAGALALAVLAGCAAGQGTDAATTTTVPPETTATAPVETGPMELGTAERPAQLVAPDAVDGPAPLLLLLHGFGASAEGQDGYLGVTTQAASRGLYVILADGSQANADSRRFWDATPACCNFTGTPVDDVGYLGDLVEQAMAERPIDPDRIYAFGHSNGGFMSYRLACERADLFAGVAVLAGADAIDADTCQPGQPVSVLHVHGDADGVIGYDGGRTLAPYPGALETTSRWAERDGCDPDPIEVGAIDLDDGISGDETAVSRYEGCDGGTEVQLDTIAGGGHIPNLRQEVVGVEVLDWLLGHPK
jgi:polyhydroxybutyrate depolymerase